MSDLEWQIEESDQAVPSPQSGALRPPWRRRRLVVTGLLLIVTVTLLFWQLARWLDTERRSAEEDVIAVYYLWRQAALDADGDLLDTMLIGQSPAWVDVQRRMLRANLLVDRLKFGLEKSAPTVGQAGKKPKVRLGQEWQSAELTFEQPYRPTGAADQTQPIRLTRTLLFRRHNSRWLLAEPDDLFWGEWTITRSELLTIEYRKRDEVLVKDLARDLETALTRLCRQTGEDDACPSAAHRAIRMESDPAIFLRFVDQQSPIFDGQILVLPTPSLIGLPVDREGYQALLRSYANRVLPTIAADLSSPAELPDQVLQILCFARNGPFRTLYEFDVAGGKWSASLSGRAFRSLSPLSDDQGLVLRESTRGIDANRLRLIYWRKQKEALLADEPNSRLLLYPLLAPVGSAQPKVIFQRLGPNPRANSAAQVDIDACLAGRCRISELAGYPLWSPDGRHALISQDEELILTGSDERPLALLGEGFSPFWMDNTHYGFARYQRQAGGLRVEVAIGQVGQARLDGLFTSHDLAALLDDPQNGQLFIDFVTAQPGSRRYLLMSAMRYGTDGDRFFVFAARLSSGSGQGQWRPAVEELSLRMQFDGPPKGDLSPLTATGSVPFSFSPDGRWLILSRVDEAIINQWSFYLHDVEKNQTKILRAGYPIYTAKRPYFDWTGDGRWLVVVDDGFLRLSAPAYDYQRLIPHDQVACTDVGWIYQDDPPS